MADLQACEALRCPCRPCLNSAEFTKAVEAKQVAQQEAERARFVVLKADQERKVRSGLRCQGQPEAQERPWWKHVEQLDAYAAAGNDECVPALNGSCPRLCCQAAVIRAEGESESAKLISDATRTAGPGLIELRRIEAARDIAATLSKGRNVTYLPGGGANMLIGVNPSQ